MLIGRGAGDHEHRASSAQDDRGRPLQRRSRPDAGKIENLLPGWVKPAGKPARAMFLMTKDKNAMRFDDVLIDGQGVLAKGTAELDLNGELGSQPSGVRNLRR